MAVKAIHNIAEYYDMQGYLMNDIKSLVPLIYMIQAISAFIVSYVAGIKILKKIGFDSTYNNKSVIAIPLIMACSNMLLLILAIAVCISDKSEIPSLVYILLVLSIAIIVFAILGYKKYIKDRRVGTVLVAIALFLSIISIVIVYNDMEINGLIYLFEILGALTGITYVIIANLDAFNNEII